MHPVLVSLNFLDITSLLLVATELVDLFFVLEHTCTRLILLSQLKFKEGDNLNLLTYRYYDEVVVDPVSYMGTNFITEVVIQPKRFIVHFLLLLYD